MKTNNTIINSMKNYSKYICMFLILVGMSINAWGAEKTGTLAMNSSVSSPVENNGVTFTWSSSNIVVNNGASSGFKASSAMTITIPSGKKLVGISKTNGSGWGSGATIYVYTESDNTGTRIASIVTGTNSYTISSNNTGTTYYLENSTAKNAWITSLSITYSNASAYKVTYNAESGNCETEYETEASANAGVTLPEATPLDDDAALGWGFYGWATSAVATSTGTAPTIVGKAGDTYYPDENVTLHAVYAKGAYTKVTSTSEITVGSGEKYLIMGYDNNCSDEGCGMYAMTHESFIDGSNNEYMYGYRLGDAPSDTYSAAAVRAEWRYEITKSTSYYYFQNIATSKYVDTELASNRIYATSLTGTHKYIITFSTNGYCTIKNNATTYSYPYLNVFDGDGSFSNGSSGWEKMMIYKETETPRYCSAPKTVKVVASPAAGGIVDFYLTSTDEEDFTDAFEDIAEAAANDGYEFLRWETSNATNAKFSDGSAYTLTTSTNDDPEFKATGSAILTAYFYKQCAVTYTLTGLTKLTGVTTVTAAVNASGFSATFSVNAHYRTTPLTCSVTMGGSTLTEGSGNDYTWDASTKTLTFPAATDITGDLVITISAEHMGYTKYAFSCSELTLTPVLATASTPIFITSAASKMVRSQDKIEISGSGLTPSTTLTFTLSDPKLADKFAIKKADGTALATDASGAIEEDAYIYYTPGAGDTSDGLDKLEWITASVSGAKPITKKLEQSIIGRHLPADFVIAGKVGNKWYALPSNMASTGTPAPSEIAVDNINNPSIAYTDASNIYGLEGPTTSGGGNNIASGYGQYVRLTMSINDGNEPAGPAPLFGSSSTAPIGKSDNAKATSNLSAGYWWELKQTNTSITNPQDAKYTIKCANNSSTLSIKNSPFQWGLYASGVEELRMIPVSPVSIVFKVAEASVVEWGQHKAIVEFDNSSMIAHYAKATLNDVTVENIALNQTRTSVLSGTTKYNYTMDFGSIDFAALTSNGAALLILWYDILDNLVGASNITVPKIVASNITINKANYPLKSDWNTEVHVLPGKTVTVDADYSPNPDVTIKELNIYPGATVVASTGTLIATNLVLRNGWTRAGEKEYNVARLQIKATANLTHTNAYLDWYIDNDQFYPVAVPFPVKVSTITYLNTKNTVTYGGTDSAIRFRYFDGANRAAGNSGNWKYYGAAGCTALPDTLKPSMGFAMAAKRPGGKAFSIVRMPMTFTNEWTALGEQGSATVDEVPLRKDTVHVYAYGNDKTAEWNKGWNLIGNPYMAVFHGDDDDSEEGIYGKILAVSKVNEEGGEKLRYVTIPNSSFTDYAQVQYKDTLLKPSSSFLVQVKDTGRLEFSNSKIDKPTAPARYTATPTKAPEQEAYIRLSYEGGSDQMGLIIGEDYTAAYETNADLMKMLGEEQNTLKTYMMYNDVEMAYVAINEDLANEWIPITVRIPETGEYTYSLTRASEIDNLEGVYLIDYETNTVTNLIESNYSFVADEGTIDDRFAINAIVGRHETPTDIDIINAGGDVKSDKPVKFIYNDKVFILHNGVVYDSTGKKVREINR